MSASLITSQIDTAPKPALPQQGADKGLITSQIDTAPKRVRRYAQTMNPWSLKLPDEANFLISLRSFPQQA